MKNPKISIILPTNKRLNFLKIAIDSVFKQTYKNWEIIIINNNSCKLTEKFIKKINSKKIKIFPIKNGGILAKSKNLGIRKSTGEWIAFLDDDDTWYPDKLKICLSYAKKYKSDFIHHPLHLTSEKRYFTKRIFYLSDRKIKKPLFLNLIYNGNTIAQSSVFVKKNLLKKVKMLPTSKKKYGWEDFYTWLKCTKYVENFLLIKKPLGTCWVGEGAISSLSILLRNYKNFKSHYDKTIKKKYGIKVDHLWWIAYNSSLYYFKKKKYKLAYDKIRNIYPAPFKITLRILIIKLVFYLNCLSIRNILK